MHVIRTSIALSLLAVLAAHMSGCNNGALRDNGRENRVRRQENLVNP